MLASLREIDNRQRYLCICGFLHSEVQKFDRKLPTVECVEA